MRLLGFYISPREQQFLAQFSGSTFTNPTSDQSKALQSLVQGYCRPGHGGGRDYCGCGVGIALSKLPSLILIVLYWVSRGLLFAIIKHPSLKFIEQDFIFRGLER